MNVLLDGREVKVGDTLYDLAHGWVEVEAIDINDVEMPILARDSSGVTWWYYTDGRMEKESPRILYWARPDIIPPPPPKKTVKKWQWVYKNTDAEYFELTRSKSKDIDEAKSKFSRPELVEFFEPYLPSEMEVKE